MGNLKVILVAVITLVLLDGLWCHGCWDQERASLLKIKPFFNHLKWPMKGEESSNCCQWEMVKCDTSTGRVIELSLDGRLGRSGWYLNASYFLPFEGLRSLNLSNNGILGFIESDEILELLDSGDNGFDNKILSSLRAFSSLRVLNLESNQLSGTLFAHEFNHLINLQKLDKSYNNIESFGSSQDPPTKQRPKKYKADLPNFLYYQYDLRFIDLSGNNFGGVFSVGLFENNTRLEEILKRDNSFVGLFPCPSHPNPNLSLMDISHNQLQGQISTNVSSVSNFNKWKIPYIPSMNSLSLLDINHNSFSGRIPRWILELSDLEDIDLSDNHLKGPLPQELCKMKSLCFLDLSKNNFSGNIPCCFIQLTNLEFVHLYKNKLTGPLPSVFMSFTTMVTLDRRGNDFSGTISNWIGNLSNLGALLLKENHFHREIPIEFCQLTQISFLDLSVNNFSGHLHSCLGSLTFENQNGLSDASPFFSSKETGALVYSLSNVNWTYGFSNDVQEVIEFVTNNISLGYTSSILNQISGMDLSINQFCGEIPYQFGNLSRVRALNLSHNNLIGSIPETFSTLKSIERPVPNRKAQFGTFDEGSYEGNSHLCGPPLNNSCNEINSHCQFRVNFLVKVMMIVSWTCLYSM
ncbi:receptor-like protein 56 [Tripterygium wilfordii]|uniref:receptor-like protein 56 n=1 Tax=Tripterygium wilfordii TaxID=458696 RepID=UPI0018F7F8F0|nr:receptor-like protein 56 [Tripterygium wilfordii]